MQLYISYNCAAVYYGMHVGSLLLELVLVSSLHHPLLQFAVPNMFVLWRCGRSNVLSRKRSSGLGSNRKHSANISVSRRRE